MGKVKQPIETPKATCDAGPSQAVQVQLSVLILQADALEHDDAVRQELKRGGFVVKQQVVVHLSADTARDFVFEVCDPDSAMYRPSTLAENKDDAPREEHDDDSGASSSTNSANNLQTADDVEVLEYAVQALASGPALVLGVEKANAVVELLQIVGSAYPSAWTESPNPCLRARFAKDAPRKLGLRCSKHDVTAAHELAFLMAHSGNKFHAQSQRPTSGKLRSSRGNTSVKSAAMGLDQLLSFLFPAHVQHSTSAGRLFVFGLYGPLDAHSRLRSGEKGRHVVTDRELTAMSLRMEREDILAVYGMCSLSQEEEEEVIRQVDHLLKCFPQYTPHDIKVLFAPLLRDSNGCMNFHEMQQVVFKERLRRVLCMKKRLHPALAKPVRNQFSRSLTRATAMKGADLVNGAPSSLFLKDVGATDVENATLVSRLLSTHLFQICHMEDGHSPALRQNVRLVRHEAPELCNREIWNPNCQKRT